MSEREFQIRAAGMVQAVIGSGADPVEWETLTRYGLNLSTYFAATLQGKMGAALPRLPMRKKQRQVSTGPR